MPWTDKQKRLFEAAAHTEGGYGGMSQKTAQELLTHDDADESLLPAYMRSIGTDISQAKKHAGGVLHIAPDGDILLLHRARDEKNFGGHFSLPGGGIEEGEEPEFGVRRESVEEMGQDAPDGKRYLFDQSMTPTGMAFHTYVQPVTNKFAPKLNGEHSGYTWAPPYALPQPMHPAVAKMIKDRMGVTEDMTPEDFAGWRDGFLKWMSEEQAEPAHQAHDENVMRVFKVRQANDSMPLALDRDSVRAIDDTGRLHVSKTNLCKACVSPYFGHEIPDAEGLGLEPDRTYYLLRDPEELQKAVRTMDRVPLLRKHKASSADDHPTTETIGAIGSDAEWADPYIQGSMTIWTGEDVEGVIANKKRQLSPGYAYRADMTPGIFNGIRHDGVMRDIKFNHVAVVEDGRQGPDIIVGDEMPKALDEQGRESDGKFSSGGGGGGGGSSLSDEEEKEFEHLTTTTGELSEKDKTRLDDLMVRKYRKPKKDKAAMDAKLKAAVARQATIGALVAYIRPQLAMDSATKKRVEFAVAPLLNGITGKRLAADHAKIAGSIAEALKGKLAKDDATTGLAKLLSACGTQEESHDEEIEPEVQAGMESTAAALPEMVVPPPATDDADEHAGLKAFLKEQGMGDDAIMKACDTLPKAGKPAIDEDNDDENGTIELEVKDPKDEKEKGMDKKAMDAAITVAVDTATKAEREKQQAIRVALDEVRPYVGELSPRLALDSAEAVYRHVLVNMMGVGDAKDVHGSALPAILRLQPKAGAKPNTDTVIAHDEAQVTDFNKMFPGAELIRAA